MIDQGVPEVKKKTGRGIRVDGGKPGAINRVGRDGYTQVKHTMPVCGETIEEHKRGVNYVKGYRYVIKRIVNIVGTCMNLGSEVDFNTDGDLRIKIDSDKADVLSKVVLGQDRIYLGGKYTSLKTEWHRLNDNFKQDPNFGFRFKSSIWSSLRAEIVSTLEATDPILKIPRQLLIVDGRREIPRFDHTPLKLMGHENGPREFLPFKEYQDGRMITTNDYAPVIPASKRKKDDGEKDDGEKQERKRKKKEKKELTPPPVDTEEEREGQTLGFLLDVEPDSDKEPLRLLLKGFYKREVKESKKTKAAKKKKPTSKKEVRIEGEDGKTYLLKEKSASDETIRIFHNMIEGKYIFQTGQLRMNKKGHLFFDVYYIRPPVERKNKLHDRTAYLTIKHIRGEGKQDGVDYVFHVTVDRGSKYTERADRWRTYSIAVNHILHRLQGIRAKFNRLNAIKQSSPNYQSITSKLVSESMKVASQRRESLLRKEMHTLIKRQIISHMKRWSCGVLHLPPLPVMNTEEAKMCGEESFPWAEFDAILQHKCRDYGIVCDSPNTRAQARKERLKKLQESVWGKKKGDEVTPEMKAELRALKERVAKDEELEEKQAEGRNREIVDLIVDHVIELGKPKKTEEQD